MIMMMTMTTTITMMILMMIMIGSYDNSVSGLHEQRRIPTGRV
jgi:uncharacterized membrane protein YqhA